MYLHTKYLCTVLGKGPYRLLTYIEKNLLLAANRTSGLVFLKRGVSSTDGVVTLFMMTPGLSKTRPHGNTYIHLGDKCKETIMALLCCGGHLFNWMELIACTLTCTSLLLKNTKLIITVAVNKHQAK